MEKIKVLIVDDQPLFASAIEIILRGEGKDDIAVVGKASDGKMALAKAKTLQPDLILMDVRMPIMDGVEATRLIHETWPKIKILILTTFDDDEYVLNALTHGAVGYLLKNAGPEELINSIRSATDGNLIVSPEVGVRLVKQVSDAARIQHERPVEYQGEVNFLVRHFEGIKVREAEVLHFLLQDFDNTEIAAKMGIAEQTVKNYLSLLYDKLGVNDRDQAKRHVKSVLSKSSRGE